MQQSVKRRISPSLFSLRGFPPADPKKRMTLPVMKHITSPLISISYFKVTTFQKSHSSTFQSLLVTTACKPVMSCFLLPPTQTLHVCNMWDHKMHLCNVNCDKLYFFSFVTGIFLLICRHSLRGGIKSHIPYLRTGRLYNGISSLS